MIQTDSSRGASLKEIREREKKQADDALKAKCEALATERYSIEKIEEWNRINNGLWYLPIIGADGEIEALALMRPISRHALSYASMNECFIEGDRKIIDDDEYFIPAANSFNKILEGKKSALLKR